MSREKYNIQFRIKAVDDFTKTHNKFHRSLESIRRHADSINDKTMKIDVVGDAKTVRDIKKVKRQANELERKNIRLLITTSAAGAVKDFRRSMGRIASMSRDVGEVISHQLASSLLVASSTGIASIGALGGAIGALGPMVGALGGGIMGLGTAFGAAGVAAGGFGALAITSLSKVFKANEDLKELREELANTTDEEERLEIMKEIEAITDSLNSGQQRAIASIQSLSGAWGELAAKLEPQAIYVFTTAMETLESLLGRLTPMFESAATVAVNLADSLKFNVEADDFNAFIGFLNTQASGIMNDIIKGLGNFTMGIVNMLTAFGPLAGTTAEGFNEMSDSFREWAAGLSESSKFQSFVDYVKTEAPKILTITGGIITGLTDIFAAFGPLASDMLDGLLEMVGGFKEWAASLSDSEAFQEFTNFVREQGPEILSFFGEFRDFLINLGIGFAEVSEKVTPLLTNLFELINSVMENNRWIGEMIGWVVTLSGVLIGILAPISLVRALFKNLIIPIIELVKRISGRMIPILVRAGTFLLRFGNVIGLISTVVIAFATVIYQNWDEIWAKTKEIFGKVASWVSDKWQTVLDWGGKISGWVGDVIGLFGDMWSGVKDWMGDVGDAVSDGWDEVMDFLSGVDLFDIGANIIDGLVGGIKSMADSLVESAKGVVGGAIDGAKRLLGINSPSRVFMEFGVNTGEGFINGMDRMKSRVANASRNMAGASTGRTFGGVMTAPSYQVVSSHSPERSESDSAVLAKILYELRKGNAESGETIIKMNDREVARSLEKRMTKYQERTKKRGARFATT